jgi:hypothetical protein
MRLWLTVAIVFPAISAATGLDAGLDTLSQARMAAIEGDHAGCARLADRARRQRDAVWQAHHVYATCQIYAIEAQRERISQEKYANGITKAIDALQFLLATPGLLIIQEQRSSVQFMVDELNKRIAASHK